MYVNMTLDEQKIYDGIGWKKNIQPSCPIRNVTWHAGDNEHSWQERGQHKSNFKPDSFNYRFNEHKFRCDSLNTIDHTKIKILYLGCSFTLGESLPVNCCWSHILTCRLGENFPYINLSQSGRGIDFAARTLYKYIDLIKPNIVLGLFPMETRYQILDGNGCCINYIAQYAGTEYYQKSSENTKEIYHSYEYATVSNDFYKNQEFCANLNLIKQLCKKYNSDFYWTSWTHKSMNFKDSNLLDFKFVHMNDYGRDGLHPGPASHQAFADKMYDFLIKNHTDIFN